MACPLTLANIRLLTNIFRVGLFENPYLYNHCLKDLKGLQYDVPAVTILAIQAVVTFFMYFAPTPGAVGFAESGYVLLFSQVINKHDITLLTISWRFLTIYIGVLIGILIAYREIFRVRPGRSG